MKKTMRSRRAVSPVIAALLLIAIAVAASVVTYSWVMSMVKSQGSRAQTAIQIEEVLFGNTTTGKHTAIKITIRNTGSATATLEVAYVYKGDTQLVRKASLDYAIAAKSIAVFSLEDDNTETWTNYKPSLGSEPSSGHRYDTDDFDLLTATGYTIKVVTDNGFTVEGTYYSPSGFS